MYEEIKDQFREVIIHSQGIPNPQIDSLFARWEKAKDKFIQRFGGLIYEWPEQIEFTLDEKEKKSRAMEFASVVHDSFGNSELAEFIDANADGFFDNKIVNVENYSVPGGMKLIKAFKFFENDKKKLRAIQDFASNYIQENKIKGTLCFSVHPLDFLSSSENTYNWRSCHALDGEYRAGNLSYMVDTTTFMVYLKGTGTKLAAFGGVEWNSKKWRMLLHASDDDELMFAGRQYPFSSKTGIDTVLNIYNNILLTETISGKGRYKYGDWNINYIDSYLPVGAVADEVPTELDGKYLIFDNKLIEINQLVKEGYNALNYNDVLRSTCYTYPYYAILNPYGYHSLEHRVSHPIEIGGEVTCLHCGDEVITNAETMRCDDCEERYGFEENDTYGCCACCGARLYIDDAITVGDDNEIVCNSCYETQCFVCDSCGEVFFNEEKVYVALSEDDEAWYCKHCHEDYLEAKEKY